MKISCLVFCMLVRLAVNGFAGEPFQLESAYEVGVPCSGLSQAFGVGEHFHFDINNWNGGAQLITKLKKGDETFVFVRTSRDEFQVRSESATPQVFFKFFTSETALAPNLSGSFLVDFFHDNGQVAVFMASPDGYFYMRARSSPPLLSPPLHFLPHKKLIAGKWIPEFVMTSRDYYPERSGLATAKIKTARLKSVDQIEFFPAGAGAEQSKSDVISFEGTEMKKNGLEFSIPHALKGCRLFVVDEGAFHERVTSGRASLEEIKATILGAGYTKDEILTWVSGFQDKTAAAEISNRIEAAFATNRIKSEGDNE